MEPYLYIFLFFLFFLSFCLWWAKITSGFKVQVSVSYQDILSRDAGEEWARDKALSEGKKSIHGWSVSTQERIHGWSVSAQESVHSWSVSSQEDVYSCSYSGKKFSLDGTLKISNNKLDSPVLDKKETVGFCEYECWNPSLPLFQENFRTVLKLFYLWESLYPSPNWNGLLSGFCLVLVWFSSAYPVLQPQVQNTCTLTVCPTSSWANGKKIILGKKWRCQEERELFKGLKITVLKHSPPLGRICRGIFRFLYSLFSSAFGTPCWWNPVTQLTRVATLIEKHLQVQKSHKYSSVKGPEGPPHES